jgi:hypothetical protein
VLIPKDALEDIIEDGRVESFFHRRAPLSYGVPTMGPLLFYMDSAWILLYWK